MRPACAGCKAFGKEITVFEHCISASLSLVSCSCERLLSELLKMSRSLAGIYIQSIRYDDYIDCQSADNINTLRILKGNGLL